MDRHWDLEEQEAIIFNKDLEARDNRIRLETLNEVYGHYTNSSKSEFTRWLNNERFKKITD